MGASQEFRADLQGLRAVAVLAVLVHHAFPAVLPGGFAGVDIFFVISGYLIGKHLLVRLADGSFSLADFYIRRARRILPALAVMLLAVWCAGYLVLTGEEFAALGKHMAATSMLANNFLLWTESGYFDAPAASKPLLHLWSLGVEEQFYLLAPCLLWLGWLLERRPMAWVIRLAMVSLLLMMFCSATCTSSSFYLPHARFWEFAVGIALARLELRRGLVALGGQKSRMAVASIELLALCGVVVLGALMQDPGYTGFHGGLLHPRGATVMVFVVAAASMILGTVTKDRALLGRALSFWERRPGLHLQVPALAGGAALVLSLLLVTPEGWPGAQAAWPVCGTALVIASRREAWVNQMLARAPLAWIGGISYPLYLWHWPALVIWRMLLPEASLWLQAVPIAASFVLAVLTKKFVEDPVGASPVRGAPARSTTARVMLSLWLLSAVGTVTVAAAGLPGRFSGDLRAVAEWSAPGTYEHWRVDTCYQHLNSSQDHPLECTPAKQEGRPLVVLWGDSHAGQLYPGLSGLQNRQPFDLVQWTAGGCPPSFHGAPGEGKPCTLRRAAAIRKLRQVAPDVVVLAGAWALYRPGWNPAAMRRDIEHTVVQLRDLGVKNVVIFGPGPMWNVSQSVDLFIQMRLQRLNSIPERMGRVRSQDWNLDKLLAAGAQASRARYVSVLRLLCDERGCLTQGRRGLPMPDLLFFDRHHMTVTGSRLVIDNASRFILEGPAP